MDVINEFVKHNSKKSLMELFLTEPYSAKTYLNEKDIYNVSYYLFRSAVQGDVEFVKFILDKYSHWHDILVNEYFVEMGLYNSIHGGHFKYMNWLMEMYGKIANTILDASPYQYIVAALSNDAISVNQWQMIVNEFVSRGREDMTGICSVLEKLADKFNDYDKDKDTYNSEYAKEIVEEFIHAITRYVNWMPHVQTLLESVLLLDNDLLKHKKYERSCSFSTLVADTVRNLIGRDKKITKLTFSGFKTIVSILDHVSVGIDHKVPKKAIAYMVDNDIIDTNLWKRIIISSLKFYSEPLFPENSSYDYIRKKVSAEEMKQTHLPCFKTNNHEELEYDERDDH